MSHNFKVGDRVRWNSRAGQVSGRITKVHVTDFGFRGYTRFCCVADPKYEIKTDRTEHVAVHKGGTLSKL